MITIKAKIKLFEGKLKRKSPFKTGYRPLFEFIKENKTSGQITLLDRSNFMPGEEAIVKIAFLNKELLGQNFGVGKSFFFYEAEEPLGKGKVLELI